MHLVERIIFLERISYILLLLSGLEIGLLFLGLVKDMMALGVFGNIVLVMMLTLLRWKYEHK
jgi:hypothetical protein